LLISYSYRTGLNYTRALTAAGLIIVVIVVTCLTTYISWKSLKSVDDEGFTKKLCELNLNKSGSGNHCETTVNTMFSKIIVGCNFMIKYQISLIHGRSRNFLLFHSSSLAHHKLG